MTAVISATTSVNCHCYMPCGSYSTEATCIVSYDGCDFRNYLSTVIVTYRAVRKAHNQQVWCYMTAIISETTSVNCHCYIPCGSYSKQPTGMVLYDGCNFRNYINQLSLLHAVRFVPHTTNRYGIIWRLWFPKLHLSTVIVTYRAVRTAHNQRA